MNSWNFFSAGYQNTFPGDNFFFSPFYTWRNREKEQYLDFWTETQEDACSSDTEMDIPHRPYSRILILIYCHLLSKSEPLPAQGKASLEQEERLWLPIATVMSLPFASSCLQNFISLEAFFSRRAPRRNSFPKAMLCILPGFLGLAWLYVGKLIQKSSVNLLRIKVAWSDLSWANEGLTELLCTKLLVPF